MNKFFKKFFLGLASLKLAVGVILGLAVCLAVGTVLESLYDTPTAQYWIYQSRGFYSLLVLFGLNIFCVAISRYPWKPRHFPFLLAHLGILILLGGAWLTQKVGIDGNLRVTEGETASLVELDTASVVVRDANRVWAFPIPWSPPDVAFRPFELVGREMPVRLKVDQFLSHADASVSFVKDVSAEGGNSPAKALPALKIRLTGGPMRISQEYWLWEGAPAWKDLQAGPARLRLGSPSESQPGMKASNEGPKTGQPVLSFQPIKNKMGQHSLAYLALSSDGKKVRGRLTGKVIGRVIHPGWKGDVKVEVLDWIPHAMPLSKYKKSRIQYGAQAPVSAIHVVPNEESDVWLGLGDRAVFNVSGTPIDVGYFPKRVVLPFSVRLEKFLVEHNPGTMSAAAYSSRVIVTHAKGQKEAIISMNEPLEMDGYTLYQASYEEGDPRPVTSVFAVNRDPGRFWKYLGSLMIVFGSVLLFAAKYRRNKGQNKRKSELGITVGEKGEMGRKNSDFTRPVLEM